MKILFCLILLAATLLVADAENCHCADTWADTTLPKRIAAFKDVPTTAAYEYIGVNIGHMNAYYLPCICTDILRLETPFSIADPSIYTDAETDTAVAVTSLQTFFEGAFSTIASTNENLANRLESVVATYKSKAAPSTTTYDLKIILRGANVTLVQELQDGLDNTVFPNGVTISNIALTYAKCSGEPDNTAAFPITREWNGAFVPPTKAVYECPDGEYILPLGAGEVTCQHDTLTWSTLQTLSCSTGCGLDPPDPPMNSFNNWDSTTRDIDHVVTYGCDFGHRSGDGNDATSTCTDEGWTPLSKTYFCKELPCNDDIPQLPAHCVTDFKNKREANTEILYTCQEGYSPITKSDHVVKCNLGKWSDLPANWGCINMRALTLAEKVKGDMDLDESQLTPDELARKKVLLEEYNFFLWVTVPSMVCLVLCMLLCLCCTKINSPLFNICRGFAGISEPEHYMKGW